MFHGRTTSYYEVCSKTYVQSALTSYIINCSIEWFCQCDKSIVVWAHNLVIYNLAVGTEAWLQLTAVRPQIRARGSRVGQKIRYILTKIFTSHRTIHSAIWFSTANEAEIWECRDKSSFYIGKSIGQRPKSVCNSSENSATERKRCKRNRSVRS